LTSCILRWLYIDHNGFKLNWFHILLTSMASRSKNRSWRHRSSLTFLMVHNSSSESRPSWSCCSTPSNTDNIPLYSLHRGHIDWARGIYMYVVHWHIIILIILILKHVTFSINTYKKFQKINKAWENGILIAFEKRMIFITFMGFIELFLIVSAYELYLHNIVS
jgi:hypothetical protein